ncbi:hypothetical protein OE88DRAFT_850142 [Heliocybe sulcata]|uniref:MIT domain-containing protein n=1 Tax=Heliocybe sulcata TaxID=5364 RepID=A0A5C3MQF4_9AGAM|nr:hypothetical protein OE88DRAFT_850142 [Heliocybe sulcata]
MDQAVGYLGRGLEAGLARLAWRYRRLRQRTAYSASRPEPGPLAAASPHDLVEAPGSWVPPDEADRGTFDISEEPSTSSSTPQLRYPSGTDATSVFPLQSQPTSDVPVLLTPNLTVHGVLDASHDGPTALINRKTSSKRILTTALDLALEPVKLDAADDPRGAIEAYRKSVALLQVMLDRIMPYGDEEESLTRKTGSRKSAAKLEGEVHRLKAIVSCSTTVYIWLLSTFV